MTKPYTWGASVWNFEKSGVEVETGIGTVVEDNAGDNVVYDLQGRRQEKKPQKGIYIVNGKKRMFR